MQTFLPYPDFVKSIRCLDKKRKWKQCVEASQILNTLFGRSNGWKNHPAVKMWKGYESSLIQYYNIALSESIKMGVRNKKLQFIPDPNLIIRPPWFGLESFHLSHQSNLLRKNREFYCIYGWNVPDDMNYFWPV